MECDRAGFTMTADEIQSAKVYALVVGIETYKAGADFDLNGPANDALKFSRWLLERGVEPEHLYLFLSPLDQNRAVLKKAEAVGLKPLPATHDLITAKIRSSLTSKCSDGGEILYVFWGGHGIITKTDTTVRRLFFADYDDDNKWNLNFNSLLEALSTFANGRGFSQQIYFVDACANAYYRGMAQTIQGNVAEVKFASSGDTGKGDQFVLFASAEYEVAINESSLGTGSFSKAVLEVLQDQPLMPEMLTVTEQMKTNFREQQRIEPVYLWRKLRGDEEEDNNTIQSPNRRSKASTSDGIAPESKQQLPSFKQIKLTALNKQKEVLIRRYEAASNQLNTLLSGADKITVNEEIKLIEIEILKVENDITAILSS
jgi:Caspase domain/Effector-associated domain 9